MSARDEVLAQVRAATSDVSHGSLDRVAPRDPPPGAASPGRAATLDLFAGTVADYRATVVRCDPADVPAEVAAALRQCGARSVVTPAGLDPGWLGGLDGIRMLADDGLGAADLDGIDAVVTAAAAGIATTGTIVLDHGPGQGRRALSLVPDVHVCVVAAGQVVHDVPEAVSALRRRVGSPLTWISGPSATSDIELDRVEGVHGPRTLVVILAG